jgi:hypothetical protein
MLIKGAPNKKGAQKGRPESDYRNILMSCRDCSVEASGLVLVLPHA